MKLLDIKDMCDFYKIKSENTLRSMIKSETCPLPSFYIGALPRWIETEVFDFCTALSAKNKNLNNEIIQVQEPDEPIQEPDEPIQEPDEPIQEPDEPIQEPDEPIQEPDKPIQEPVKKRPRKPRTTKAKKEEK